MDIKNRNNNQESYYLNLKKKPLNKFPAIVTNKHEIEI